MPNKIAGLALLALLVSIAIKSSSAVMAVSLEELSRSAQIVLEGEVVGTSSSFNTNKTAIHTHVTFRVVDVVKGVYGQPEITLRFLGGTVGEISLDVSDSTLPVLGEKGIYFVQSVDRFQINPLYGMDQGHFLILEFNGKRIVATRNKRVVMGFSPAPRTFGRLSSRLSNGDAAGLSLAEAGKRTAGMTVLQFKQTVRSIEGL